MNRTSATFGQWVAFEFSDRTTINCGSEIADFAYKCTDYYRADDEGGVRWNCPKIAIECPVGDPIISSRDAALPGLDEFLAF